MCVCVCVCVIVYNTTAPVQEGHSLEVQGGEKGALWF